jgi:predicted nucleotide-binding protein (sugar kinase/HSP70/actin superfamily)
MRYRADPPIRRIHPLAGKIGIPRSLCYDELRIFFDRLLEYHGFETVVSPKSSGRILELGLKRCIDEVCLPLKAFFGHVEALREQGLDTVLVPRLISLARGRNLCPKFAVLPDLIAASFPELQVVSPYLDLHHSTHADLREHLFHACRPLLTELDAWSARSPQALAAAWRAEQDEPDEIDGHEPGAVNVAAIGHLYAERDRYLGLGVARLLERLEVSVVRFPGRVPPDPVGLEQGMYYEPTVRTARAIARSLELGLDGIVLLTYFACGPDSYSADTFLYRLKRQGVGIPVLRLILDEHTSAEGLLTRLNTFVDVAGHHRQQRRTDC